jgi:DNA-binding beta-propeller fold protein YncE
MFAVTSCKETTNTYIYYKSLPEFYTTELPVGAVNVPYTATIEVVGGELPYTFEITVGVLPDGLSLDADTGIISGTPTSSCICPFNLRVTDSKPGIPNTDEGGFLIRIAASEYTFDSKWGTDFSSGKFLQAWHIGVDSAGSIFFADYNRETILKFDSAKNFVLSFGGQGYADDEFDRISNIAVHNDVVYAADWNKIKMFDTDGSFLAIDDYPDNWYPNSLCIDTTGNIFVLEDEEQVIKVDQDWNELAVFGNFDYAVDIDTDGTNVYVADEEGRCIYVFDNTGMLVDTWTSDLDHPTGISIDRANSLAFVSDNTLVKRFTTAGVFELEIGSPTGYWVPEASVCYSAGYVYTARERAVEWFDAASGNPVDSITTDLSGDDCLDYPRGIAVSKLEDIRIDINYPTKDTLQENNYKNYIVTGAGDFRIAALDVSENSVTLDVNGNTVCLQKTQFAYIKNHHQEQTAAIRIVDILLEEAGEAPEDTVEFAIHLLTSASVEDKVYVADTNNDCVKAYDLDGSFLFRFGQLGSGNGEFCSPKGIAVDNNFGVVYVADSGNDRVQRFDLDGNFLDAVYAGDSAFSYPRDCAVDEWGNFFVADSSNDDVAVFDVECNCMQTISLTYPQSIAVHKDRLYVVDEECIVVLDKEGNFISNIIPNSWPETVAVDTQGDVYVTDYYRIMKFDKYGNQLAIFGTYGAEDGEFGGIVCLDIDKNGNLYVCDTHNCRVQKFTPVQ